MKAESVLVKDYPGRLVAMFVVIDGQMAAYANPRLTDEATAVAWAERKASAGQLADFWLEGDEQVA
jgi:hypothetical protein